jgi:hypothetical protein
VLWRNRDAFVRCSPTAWTSGPAVNGCKTAARTRSCRALQYWRALIHNGARLGPSTGTVAEATSLIGGLAFAARQLDNAPMCVRFTLRRGLNLIINEIVELLLPQADLFEWTPRYNIAPTQLVAAVRPTADAGGRELVPLKWGPDPELGEGQEDRVEPHQRSRRDGSREAGIQDGVQAPAVSNSRRRFF